MDLSEKNNNRLKFRYKAFLLVVSTLLISAGLAIYGKLDGFSTVAAGVFTFAGMVFGADYFSKPTGEK